MVMRKIVKIDEDICNGCGNCIPNCPEGALQIIDDKARVISDLFCDGLGACIGECPEEAISIEEREAEKYDERKVMANVVKQGSNVIKAHLEHLRDHGQTEYFDQAVQYLDEKEIENHLGSEGSSEDSAEDLKSFASCPGEKMMDRRGEEEQVDEGEFTRQKSQLRQWPVQINLVPTNAPYFENADLLIAADCVPFAYADFHRDLLKDKILMIGCPKLDDAEFYRDKIAEIIKNNNINSITVAHMEVPCCFGLVKIIDEALKVSGKDVPVKDINIGVKGEVLAEVK